ncbi:NAD(P)-binding protein [Mycena alexandri]|uniref:NAD(P)-binding protein n=1 Tax=Mycena alexandri TaxID=1745969 RepID=A0AAD6X5P5_9AGAR|nr:NAD(P)-binding protein [Mycena alexandri]
MTITDTTSAPLIAVVGATGTQGGSVIQALADSDKQYRVRGFTRDATKATAEALKKQGVEMVSVNLVVENKDEIYRAFAGADFAFLVTNFWEHTNMEREISEGKLLIDAAKAAGVKGIIWSGLMPVTKISGGKYTHVYHFDGKAVVTEYGCNSGVPFVDVQAGCYAENFVNAGNGIPLIKKQGDGSYVIAWAVTPDIVLPIIDMDDYGLYLRRVLEAPVFPNGSEVLTSGEDITAGELVRQISEITGKKVIYKQITVDEWNKSFTATGLPPPIVTELIEGFLYFEEFGCKFMAHFRGSNFTDLRAAVDYGGKPSSSREGLGRPTRSWKEVVRAADWSKTLV